MSAHRLYGPDGTPLEPTAQPEQATRAAHDYQRSGRTVVLNEDGGRTSVPVEKAPERVRELRPKCPTCRKGRLEPSDTQLAGDDPKDRSRAARRRRMRGSVPQGIILRCDACGGSIRQRLGGA